jgi:hypothetical protein
MYYHHVKDYYYIYMPTYSSPKRPYELKNELLTRKRRGEDPSDAPLSIANFGCQVAGYGLAGKSRSISGHGANSGAGNRAIEGGGIGAIGPPPEKPVKRKKQNRIFFTSITNDVHY